ncbi:MAG: 2-phospho-L-lactate transferase [Actinomycetota bacterium]|jgi:LPPG:FO 2-phospho-L-lactate transferase|nr:2-phospho-L-lactate transferase [Actinomycetota bacterium]MDQ1504032.1 2-phospho-L-lactate transferase [Actinomycetota bacterium]
MGTIAALAGGVGAARFLRGLVRAVPATDVVVVGNTGDDDVFHGLHVSPDLDTVTYTLAGAVGAMGWGLAGDTFRTLEAYERYGEATWFRLGDADLATHLYRTSRLREGATLTEVTAEIALAWGLKVKLLPMSDDRVATVIDVASAQGGEPVRMAMQEWFVRERAQPPVAGVRFEGAAEARPGPAVLEALREADAILLCPSNPVISIGPILALPGVRDALRARREQVVAVSPIIRGATVKGPADRLMAAAGIEVSCAGVASIYADLCGTLLVDDSDADRVGDVERHGVRAAVAPILMRDADGAEALARRALDLVS